MHRDIYTKLLQWKQSKRRKPLILRGARQVGKTYIIKSFGQSQYPAVVYLNFENDEELHGFFTGRIQPHEIIKQLNIYLNTNIHAECLIIFDEIQACPPALNSLKYFHEQANEYHIIAAGSLLGVTLARSKGFPVGQVNFLDLYPLSFMEFLTAMGQADLRELTETHHDFIALAEPLHNELTKWLKQYFFTGGMPEVVKDYRDNGDLQQAREIQKEILDAFTLDFSKHAAPHDILKINEIWRAIPSQLAKENKKFKFAAINKSARAREYVAAMQWLIDAGLILKSWHVSAPKLPLTSYSEQNVYKIFALDVGLLGAMSDLPPQVILTEHALFTEFKGALSENYVAQELTAYYGDRLFYWSSQGRAEIDFVIQHDMHITPLEVKSGKSTKTKSLHVYFEKFQPANLTKVSAANYNIQGKILNLPLYALSQYKALLTTLE